MTISIGSLSSQPTTEPTQSTDHVTSSIANKTKDAEDLSSSSSNESTTTLLSSAASVATLTAQALDQNSIRTDRVEQLRQSIANGTYQVEPAKVADAMLAEWRG
ncbi:MAG: flagellar biosynthesis anti-sigma factor FlgM [Terriglobales bacterium]